MRKEFRTLGGGLLDVDLLRKEVNRPAGPHHLDEGDPGQVAALNEWCELISALSATYGATKANRDALHDILLLLCDSADRAEEIYLDCVE